MKKVNIWLLRRKVSKKKNSNGLLETFHKKDAHYNQLLSACKNNMLKDRDAKIKSQLKPKSTKTPYLKFKCCTPSDYKQSLGERKVEEFLMLNQVIYRKEVSFLLLPSLRFDFYLPKHKICIEFDGKQHYVYTPKFDKLDFEAVERRKLNDKRKNIFCKENDLKILRIPYYKIKSIKSILKKGLAS
jgi:very-short-patch-repair endonuclease